MVDMVISGNLRHTFPVSAVGKDKQFVGRFHGGSDGCFHTVGSAALQEHIGIFVFIQPGDSQQTFTDWGYDSSIIIFIPGTPILEHGFAHCL